MWDLFLDLEKFCNKMLLDIFKLFPSRLMNVISPYFYRIEKHQCHSNVEKVFLVNQHLILHECMCFQMHNMFSFLPLSTMSHIHSIFDLKELQDQGS